MGNLNYADRASLPVLNGYRRGINERVAGMASLHEKGIYSPYIIHSDSLPFLVLLISVFCLHYLKGTSAVIARYSAFILITVQCLWIIKHVRTLGLAYGYGIGLIFGVGIMQSAALLIFNDPTQRFKRLEVRRDVATNNEDASSAKTASAELQQTNGHPRKRKEMNGSAHDLDHGSQQSSQSDETAQRSMFYWQSYPSTFWHRLDWVIDLLTCFRGPGWNWRLRTLGPLSKDSLTDLPRPTSDAEKQRFYIRQARNFILLYLTIDCFKVIMMYDPYFTGTGFLSSPAPPALTHLCPIFSHFPILTRIYRLTLSCAGVIVALSYVFTLCPLFYGFLLPRILPIPHYTPLPEPFLYPPQQNSFLNVLDHGLPGWWGQWWHQMFRFGISEPSSFLLRSLNWDPRSQKSRLLQVTIAFTITGLLHLSGSSTMYAPTNPISGPFLFFVLQGFGVMGQTYFTKLLLPKFLPSSKSWPQWLTRLSNLLFVAIWMYYTGPLFADDVAKSALWNFEPVPISLVRGLGFGLEGEGWWCWHGKWIIWWDGREGDGWWRRGWALI